MKTGNENENEDEDENESGNGMRSYDSKQNKI